MKTLKSISFLFIFLLFSAAFISCSSDDDNGDNSGNTPDSCYVHLFDGDNFTDDNIIIDGEGEYADLDDLPNSDGKNWTDEADSFKVGENTVLTTWTKTNFEGDSTIYEAGEYPSEEEPYSLKITCD